MRQSEPEVNFDEVLRRVRSIFGGFRIGGGGGLFYLVLGLLAIGALIWLGTGVYTVVPGEEAAMRTFGKYRVGGASALIGGTDPGLHWWWPSPVGTRAKVKVADIRRLELGVRGNTQVLQESLMITGDENIVDAQLLVQYDVKDIEQFLFRVIDPTGLTIRDIAETSLRQVVGSRNIDDVLTIEKEAVQADTKILMQILLDDYQSGIRVREVKLLNVLAPEQVRDAFDDVVRAKEDKERIKNLAQAYEERILPTARGTAEQLKERAEGFKAERINLATGQAARFLSILAEYRKAPEVTRQRMYLETMEQVFPGITKLVTDPDITPIIVLSGDNGGNFVPLPLPTTE